MPAIILCAGVGSRLRPITDHKPKCLVEVNGVPILGHALKNLIEAACSPIFICTGYREDLIRNYCNDRFKHWDIRFVPNMDYTSTNNMYSLSLALPSIEGACLILNGDVVFDKAVLDSLESTNQTSVAIDRRKYFDESMKISVADGHIVHMAKNIPPTEAYAVSIDIYKIAATDIEQLKKAAIAFTRTDKTQWTEVLLNRLFQSGAIRSVPCDIGTARWFEIDNMDDLAQAEILFNDKLRYFPEKRTFLLDGDGTLFLQNEALPGAKAFLEHLQARGKACFFLSNNSSKTPAQHAARLAQLKLPIGKPYVATSIQAATGVLRRAGLNRIYWVATKSVTDYLNEEGFTLTDVDPEAILLTYDTELTYDKLVTTAKLLRNRDVPFFATHTDMVCPTPDGPVPDLGSILAMMRTATGREPCQTFGKPSPVILEPVLAQQGYAADETVIVGDRLYTDISMGASASLTTVLVLTGETTRAEYEFSEIRADVVVPNLGELIAYL